MHPDTSTSEDNGEPKQKQTTVQVGCRSAGGQRERQLSQGNEKTPVNMGENINSPTLTGVFQAEDTGLEPAAPYGVPQFQ